MVGPKAKREAVSYLLENKNFKPHRAYKLVGLRPSTFYYKKINHRNDAETKAKILEVAQKRIRWGCPRIYAVMRREGFKDNYKRVERLYSQMGLSIRKRAKKKLRDHLRLVLPEPQRPNDIWSMDFVSEKLFDQRRFRCFNIVDDFTRENVAIYTDRSIKSDKLVHLFNKIKLIYRHN